METTQRGSWNQSLQKRVAHGLIWALRSWSIRRLRFSPACSNTEGW